MMGDKGFIPRLKEYDKDNILSQKIMHPSARRHAQREVLKRPPLPAAKASSVSLPLLPVVAVPHRRGVLAMECYDRRSRKS